MYPPGAQDVNPVTMWLTEAYSDDGAAAEITYACESCPYGSYNYFGGLEYNNDKALLDGSVGTADWYFAVGATEVWDEGLPGPCVYGECAGADFAGGDDDRRRRRATATTSEDASMSPTGAPTLRPRVSRVTLETRPNEFYFEPSCVSCMACYDANGYWRAGGGGNGTSCPSFCRGDGDGKRIRAWEAAAPHHVAIFSRGFAAANCSVSPSEGTRRSISTAESAGCAMSVATAIESTPVFAPGGGQYTGFFVAPRAANYTFSARFETGVELWLSDDADPRRARLVLGGDASDARFAPPADGDKRDGWTRWNRAWYKDLVVSA